MIFPLKPPLIGNFQFHSTGICANLRESAALFRGPVGPTLETLDGTFEANKPQDVDWTRKSWMQMLWKPTPVSKRDVTVAVLLLLVLVVGLLPMRRFSWEVSRSQNPGIMLARIQSIYPSASNMACWKNNPFSSMIFQAAPHLMTPEGNNWDQYPSIIYLNTIPIIPHSYYIYMYYKLYPNHSPIAIISQS